MTARPDDPDRTSPPGADTPPLAGASPADLPTELREHPTYEVLRELGRGGMGVVYLARNGVMNRLEVLKVLQDRLAGQPGLLQRFVNEIQMAARLHHPNIVTAYSAFRAGDALVLAMEYVEGESLAQWVKRHGPLPVDRACAFARQVALGLQHAHEKGMVHRDIKPHNLMLSREGVVKVLDFGLAKVSSEAADNGLTSTGAVMGTPDYMPPEQALDARSADIRADIYSLGCTLFFLLTGKPPFVARSAYEAMYAHNTQPPPPLASGRSDIPDELAELVARMLEKRPEGRPRAPGEVAAALTPFASAAEWDGEGRPAPELVPPRRPVHGETTLLERPRRGSAVMWGVALAAVAALVALGLWAGGVFSGPSGREGQPGSGAGLASEWPGQDKKGAGGAAAGPPPREVTNLLGMKLVLVPAGAFDMGSPASEPARNDNDEPQHEAEITAPFYLGVHEVTQKQFKDVMGYNPSFFSGDGKAVPGGLYSPFSPPGEGLHKLRGLSKAQRDALPVENVSYEEAVAFCNELTRRERAAGKLRPDQTYRLPSEAQWEYACRGGAAAYQLFHFGQQLSAKEANFDSRHPYRGAKSEMPLGRTAPAGSYPPNAFGLHDMHGNVMEWCRDWYDNDTYRKGPFPRADALGPEKGSERVFRGGSWDSAVWICRSAYRYRALPSYRNNHLGFRVALVPSAEKE